METITNQDFDRWLSGIIGYVRQYRELQELENRFSPILRVNSTEETATHMAVRLATEREIQGRKDYLAGLITNSVVDYLIAHSMLSKQPTPQTNHNEK